MCGLAGMIDWRTQTTADALRAIGEAMNSTLAHRGPDAGAIWTEAESCTVLAHRRLAIIDLSPGGAQPMQSRDGRYVIILNGEIYNYRDIRREIEAAGLGWRQEVTDAGVHDHLLGAENVARSLDEAEGIRHRRAQRTDLEAAAARHGRALTHRFHVEYDAYTLVFARSDA